MNNKTLKSGNPVLPKQLKIFITKFDIEKGNRSDCKNCPAALALNRRVKHSTYNWKVGSQGAVLGRAFYLQPEKLKKSISKFDNSGKGFVPGVYTLERVI